MFSALPANEKGFTLHISKTFEHAHAAHFALLFTNHARMRQRCLIITLLDLKMPSVKYIKNVIKSAIITYLIIFNFIIIKKLYTNSKTSIITSNFNTQFIQVSGEEGDWPQFSILFSKASLLSYYLV